MSLCITTVVNEKYQRYLPVFIYFCMESYPDCGIKIFLTENLLPKYKEHIKLLINRGNLVIIEKAFTNFPKSNQELKTLRWIMVPEMFDGYDNIYVGDIDLLICRELRSLEEQHIVHCENINLPYSNSVRKGSTRLSGLHFIKKEDYYSKVLLSINKYTKKLKEGKLFNVKNEVTLYNIIKDSGLGFSNGWFRPHHGLHIGLWRKGPRKIEQRYWDVIDKDAYRDYYNYYLKLKNYKDPLFKEITNLKEIVFMEKSLEKEFAGMNENTG